MKRFVISVVAGAAAMVAGSTSAEEFISIGTGGVTGVYYPTGQAICRLSNKSSKDHGIRCSAESTGGSVYNINAVRSGDLEFGVAQSDWQYHAYHGTSKFEEKGAFEGLRHVFSVHAEPFTLVVRADSGIDSFEALKGKRVNVGNPGSGQRATMDIVLDAFGMSTSDYAVASELKGSEMAQALCDNKLDAIVYTIGHPSAAIKEATTSCEATLITVSGSAVDGLVNDASYYRVATIPGGTYRGTDNDVTTFGVGATFVSSSDVSDEVVYTVVKSTIENLDLFKKLHPAFAGLDAKQMALDSQSAPMHSGAAKAFVELGVITQAEADLAQQAK